MGQNCDAILTHPVAFLALVIVALADFERRPGPQFVLLIGVEVTPGDRIQAQQFSLRPACGVCGRAT